MDRRCGRAGEGFRALASWKRVFGLASRHGGRSGSWGPPGELALAKTRFSSFYALTSFGKQAVSGWAGDFSGLERPEAVAI